MDRFIVLRDENQAFRRPTVSPSFRTGPNISLESAGIDVPPAPDVAGVDLTPAEVRSMARDPSVISIARSIPTKLIAPFTSAATPAAAGATWGVKAVGADTSPFTGAGVKVAVLDTGIDANHPAFVGVTLIQKDFTGSGNGDAQGHGTHCAGTIFGRDVNGTRIGVARGITEALIGKVLGNDGSGTSEMLFEGMKWTSTENAKVVSMSLGFDFPGLVDRLVNQHGFPVALATSIALVEYRANLGVFDNLVEMFRVMAHFNGGGVVVAATGNESDRDANPDFEVSASLPAAANGILSVGALGESPGGLVVAPFSNIDPQVAGPGVGVISAKAGGGLVAFNGTSMACPHAAGVAALWWEALRGSGLPQTQKTVEARMLASATLAGLAASVDVADRGHGLVQAPSAAVS